MSVDDDAVRASDPACPEAELVRFLSHRDRYVRWNAAQNAGATDTFRLAALAMGDAVVAEAVGSLGDALSLEVLEAVFAHPERQARRGLGASARRRSTMERIASDPDPLVRASLAGGWQPVPDDLLRILAKDRSAAVRAAVAFRDEIPDDIVLALAADRSATVRMEILAGHDQDPRIARALRDDPDESIRQAARELASQHPDG